MSLAKEEKILFDLLQEAITAIKNPKGNIGSKYQNRIGFMLSYYLKAILKKMRDSNIKDKWIDGVEWKSLYSVTPNKIKGIGFLWWGFRKDNTSKTFPENFYCELELDNSGKKIAILYLFRFQMDGKDYELKS